MEPLRLDALAARIAAHEPTRRDPAPGDLEAAVALVLCEASDDSVAAPEIRALFIERSIREHDPWSGHMALPGGRRDPGDVDLETTARRECLEEVGITLPDPVARLSDCQGVTGKFAIVAPHVFVLESRPATVLDPEV